MLQASQRHSWSPGPFIRPVLAARLVTLIEYSRRQAPHLLTEQEWKKSVPCRLISVHVRYGGVHRWGIPKMDGLKWKIPLKYLKWMMTGGTPISGNTHIYVISGVRICFSKLPTLRTLPRSFHPQEAKILRGSLGFSTMTDTWITWIRWIGNTWPPILSA